MATVTEDLRGIIIELDNNETNQLVDVLNPFATGGASAGAIAPTLVALGVSTAAAGIVAAALALHIAWEVLAIQNMNQGNGVILTAPWVTPGVVIPATRFPTDINNNWVFQENGTFVGPGGDAINYSVEHGAVDPTGITFRMVNQTQSRWDKAFILRDGEGNEWTIRSTASTPGENGLWANQVLNNQMITFQKPSFFGIWINVFSVGGLGALQGGDRVTFTWIQD